jgi:hypothetical protein
VLDLRLAKPVEVDTNVIDVGKTKRVKSNVSSHRSIKLMESSR